MPVLTDKVYRQASSQTPDRRVNAGRGAGMMDPVFIVAWDGEPPDDKAEWTGILREVLASEPGSYRILFRKEAGGWRFTLDWRQDPRFEGEDVVANTPESVAYNVYVTLAGGGKPLDPGWRPGG
jgi:hypothetical protein